MSLSLLEALKLVLSAFPITMGVKQGRVLAPVLFSVIMVAVTLLANRYSETLERKTDTQLRYICDGGAFNLQRLGSSTNTKLMTVRDLQYADDAALVAGSDVELQEKLTVADA